MNKNETVEHFETTQQGSGRTVYILILVFLGIAAAVVIFMLFKVEKPEAVAETAAEPVKQAAKFFGGRLK